MLITTYKTIFIIINNTINDSVTNKKYINNKIESKEPINIIIIMFIRSHTNIMKHEHVFTQMDQTKTPEVSRTISQLFPQDIKIKLGWKALYTLLYTNTLILECINITLNKHCNHQHYQTTVSLLKTIPKLLPMHSKTDIPKGLCVERREFPLKASNTRVNVCTYQDRIRVDVGEFINVRATIKCVYLTSREFISFNGALPFVRHEVLRQIEILRNARNST